MILLALPILLPSPDLRAIARWERRDLPTDDKFKIAADYHAPRGLAKGNRAPAVILVHEAGGSRADLETLADLLAGSRIAALRLDLRGHGDSKKVQGATEDYVFKEAEFRGDKPFLKMHRDLRAAVEELRRETDVDPDRLGIVGLGSGGSLALRFAMSDAAFRAAVLVSPPGLADRGFDLTQDLKRLGGRSLLLVCDKKGERVARDLETIATQSAEGAQVKVSVTKEEGKEASARLKKQRKGKEPAAALLQEEKGLDRTIAAWIRDRFAGVRKH